MAKTKIPGLQKLVIKNWKGIGIGAFGGFLLFGANPLGLLFGGIAGGYIYQNYNFKAKRKK